MNDGTDTGINTVATHNERWPLASSSLIPQPLFAGIDENRIKFFSVLAFWQLSRSTNGILSGRFAQGLIHVPAAEAAL